MSVTALRCAARRRPHVAKWVNTRIRSSAAKTASTISSRRASFPERAAAFAAREGIAQDLAHVFMTCARELDMPARYVSGYVAQSDALPHAGGAHAWAEIYLEDYGWIGFDCANGLCPIDTHARVAAGLDFADAAPVRGARQGGEGENLAVLVSAREAESRFANQ